MPQQEEEVVEEGRGVASDTAAARLRHRARRLAAALDPRAPRHVDEAPSWEEDLRDSVEVPLPTEGDRTSWAVVARTWLAYSGPGLLISVGAQPLLRASAATEGHTDHALAPPLLPPSARSVTP